MDVPKLRDSIVRTSFGPFKMQRQAAAQLQRIMQRHLDAAEKIGEAVQNDLHAATKFAESARMQIESINRQAAHFASAAERLREQNLHIANQLRQWVRAQPERDKEEQQAREKLACFGWFPDPQMPWNAPILLAREIEKNTPEEVIEHISRYFRGRISDIEIEMERNHPGRKQIFHDAFQAHREGKYNLSIPVFLSQADGMWWDKFKKGLFSTRDREKVFDDFLVERRNHFFTLMFGLLRTSVPLIASESQRDSSFSELNRHQVLHGEVVTYGTEQNSLKAISFLSWLNWILSNSSGA